MSGLGWGLVCLAALLWPSRARPAWTRGGDHAVAPNRWRLRLRGDERAEVVWVARICQLTSIGLNAGMPAQAALLVALDTHAPPQSDGAAAALAGRLSRARGDLGAHWLRPVSGEGPRFAIARAHIGAAWSLADELGSPLVLALADSAEAIAHRLTADDQVSSAGAGPRSTMWLLTALPLFGLLGVALSGRNLVEVYAASPLGLVCLLVGVVLTGLGWLSSNWILNRARR